jgi:hypothetical protein
MKQRRYAETIRERITPSPSNMRACRNFAVGVVMMVLGLGIYAGTQFSGNPHLHMPGAVFGGLLGFVGAFLAVY